MDTQNMFQMYLDAFLRAFEQYSRKEPDRTEKEEKEFIKRLVFYGVRFVSASPKRSNGTDDSETAWAVLIELIILFIGKLTPQEFMTVFPVSKKYDGNRWETKDYYYTMEYLDGIGMNTEIGDNVLELLFDYVNPHITRFALRHIEAHDFMRKLDGHPSIAEEWAEEIGIRIYHKYTDEASGKQFLVDRDGRTVPLRKTRAKYLKLVH